MTKITSTVPVSIYTPCWSASDVRQWAAEGSHKKIAERVAYGVGSRAEYMQIGTAEVVITLMTPSETAAAEVAELNAQLAEVRAAFHAKQAQILERISKLQALESSVEV